MSGSASMPGRHMPHDDIALLAKLGSIVVHVDEMLSEKQPYARALDEAAIRQLLVDPVVCGWLAEMQALSLVPVKRSDPNR